MLKFTINKNKNVPSLKKIDIENNLEYDDTNARFIITNHNSFGLTDASVITFINTKCSDDTFVSRQSKSITLKNNVCSFEPFDNIKLNVSQIETLITKTSVDDPDGLRTFLKITLAEPQIYKDNNARDCEIEVKECIYGAYKTVTTMKRCIGDYILYNDIFLFQATDIDEDGKYVFGGIPLNKRVNLVWHLKGRDEDVILEDVFVAVNSDGNNNMYELFFDSSFGENSYIIDDILNSIENSFFFIEDERFINKMLEITEGTTVYLNQSFLKIGNVLENTIETNLNKEDIVKSLFNEEKNGAKNSILDYEKQIFFPVYSDINGNAQDLIDITFNLHFLEREDTENYDSWKIKENALWNNYRYIYDDNDVTKLVPECKRDGNELTPSDADLVGYLGFTDEDIYYQKKKVTESFLRLAFYDSSDRRIQKLLMYSTLFMNGAKLYSDYVYKLNFSDALNSDNLVFDEGIVRLSTTFKCGNKYSTNLSSEGFYLYLFPQLLNSLPEPEDGKDYRIIYMKIEFNNAKYGITTPFIFSRDENEIVPLCYRVNSEGDTSYVDMQALFNDMYIPIKIRYDYDKKRYTWQIDGITSEHAVLNIFEPRINCGGEVYKCLYVKPKLFNLAWNDSSEKTVEYYLHGGYVFTVQAPNNVHFTTTTTSTGGTLVFYLENNKTIGIKNTKITLSYGDEIEEINITQGEYDPYFGLENFRINGVVASVSEVNNIYMLQTIDGKRNTIEFTIKSDLPYDEWFSSGGFEWLRLDSTSEEQREGYYYRTYVYSTSPNITNVKTGTLHFKYYGKGLKLKDKGVRLTQNYVDILLEDLMGNEIKDLSAIDMTSSPENKTIKVYNRYYCRIQKTSGEAYFNLNSTDMNSIAIPNHGVNEFTINVKENYIFENRSMGFSAICGTSNERITINQTGAPLTLTIDPTETIKYDSTGHLLDGVSGTYMFTTNSIGNFNFSLSQDSWMRFSVDNSQWELLTNGNGKKNYLYWTLLNTNTGAAKSGTLTATLTSGSSSQSVSVPVTQKGGVQCTYRVFVTTSVTFEPFIMTSSNLPNGWSELGSYAGGGNMFVIEETYIQEGRYIMVVPVISDSEGITDLSAWLAEGGGYYSNRLTDGIPCYALYSPAPNTNFYYFKNSNLEVDDRGPRYYINLNRVFQNNNRTVFNFTAFKNSEGKALTNPTLTLVAGQYNG